MLYGQFPSDYIGNLKESEKYFVDKYLCIVKEKVLEQEGKVHNDCFRNIWNCSEEPKKMLDKLDVREKDSVI